MGTHGNLGMTKGILWDVHNLVLCKLQMNYFKYKCQINYDNKPQQYLQILHCE
jgi:hypothetical protein